MEETGELPIAGLVMAMPRRELFAVQGVQTTMAMPIIECLAEESWFADPAALREDIDAKEVRVGLVLKREREWLVSEHGHLLHATAVPPQAVELGDGLKSLRELARLAAGEVLGAPPRGIQLWAYLNDDHLPELRPFFIMIYLVDALGSTGSPAGMSWIAASQLAALPLDPVSIMVSDALPR